MQTMQVQKIKLRIKLNEFLKSNNCIERGQVYSQVDSKWIQSGEIIIFVNFEILNWN